MAKVTITKSYSRKVDLKAITSRYQNIEIGTSITLGVNVESEEDLNKALRILGKKTIRDNEREVAEAITVIKELVDDPENEALLGEGTSVSKISRESSIIDGMDSLLKKYGLEEE